ncbi:MAG: hypothetical protein MUE31_12270, partial [Candidatus Nanopelagicales bacterium]|nr:hypothetical protein [Candidatus Nanopelagicales bacterium]
MEDLGPRDLTLGIQGLSPAVFLVVWRGFSPKGVRVHMELVNGGGWRMGQGRGGMVRLWAVLTAIVVVASGLVTVSAPKASAWPAFTPHPETVSADGLPTVQIDGVVWAQAIVGDTVYVGGSFTEARPAGGGAAVARNNMLAYNIVTGNLITSFAPNPNAQVRTITA